MTETALSNLGAWSLQAGVVAVAAALVARVVPVDAPAVRYAWWRGVLLVCLLLPMGQPWQPTGRAPAPVPALEVPTHPADAPTPAPAGMTESTALAGYEDPGWRWAVAAVLVTGALLRLAWLGAGLIRLRRVRQAGVPATAADGPDLLHALIDAGADVRHVASIRQPVTFGLVRPVVLLPEGMRTLSPGVQRAVLAHELWHVRRHDWAWSLSEELLRAVLWFHPAIWHLVSRVQGAREEVVDELSILATSSRRSYLEALLAFADEPTVYPAAPFVRRRQLFNRMMLISREGVMSSRRIVASSAGMAGALVFSGWYGAMAFPLTDPGSGATEVREPQAQTQPRDPRPGTAGPATSREQALQAAIAADPSKVANWLELAKLQEDRGALAEAEQTLGSAMAATSGSREVLLSQARFLSRHGQFDRAVATLEDAAARNPGDPAGHHLVATWYWEKAQKDPSLTPADKLMYIDSGIRAEDNAIAQQADYVDALVYKNILLRMKGNLETDATRRQELFAEADALRNRAMELSKQRTIPRDGSVPSAPPPPPPPPPPLPSEDYQVDGQQAVRIGGNIRTPTKIHDVRPAYPPVAQDARVSGMVIIEAVIDTRGDVRSARVLRSIPLLDEAALEAVKQWRFTPTVQDGVALPVVMTVTVNFTLQ